jgi:hypothetical protein
LKPLRLTDVIPCVPWTRGSNCPRVSCPSAGCVQRSFYARSHCVRQSSSGWAVPLKNRARACPRTSPHHQLLRHTCRSRLASLAYRTCISSRHTEFSLLTMGATPAENTGARIRDGTPVKPLLRRGRVVPAPTWICHHVNNEERRLGVDDAFIPTDEILKP